MAGVVSSTGVPVFDLFGVDAELTEVVAGGVAEGFAPSVVFGEGEDEFGGGDAGF